MSTTTASENSSPTPLQSLPDDELVTEVRRRTIGIIHYLDALQLIRVYDAIKDIAPDLVK